MNDALVRRLREVHSVGVVTGAGISAEAGIRPYRGEGGLYDDPLEGDRTIEALSAPTLATDPDRTWRVVASLARQAAGARPGRGHRALAAIEQIVSPECFVLLTQNVDELHQLAGNRNVIDIHGSVFAKRCTACPHRSRLEREALAALEAAPLCERCGGVERPDAVLFGEMLPTAKLARIQSEMLASPPDLVMIVGTSALFPYVTEPVLIARMHDRLTVEINPEPTPISEQVEFAVRRPAGEVLPEIERLLRKTANR